MYDAKKVHQNKFPPDFIAGSGRRLKRKIPAG
jgi:hypothetical protein